MLSIVRPPLIASCPAYLSLRASRSDSSRQRMSSSRTAEILVSRFSRRSIHQSIPGPLTLRMMLRVVSSMNSTRHWVTPPREPVQVRNPSSCILSLLRIRRRRTGTAENAGDLDELDGDLGGIHCERLHGSARAKRYGGLRRRAYCGKSGDWWVVGVRVWC